MDNQQGITQSQKRTKNEDNIKENEIFKQIMIELNKKLEKFDSSKITKPEQTRIVISMFSFICDALPKALDAMNTENQLIKSMIRLQNEVLELKNEVSDLKKETLENQIQNSAKFLEVKNEVSDLKKETLANHIQDSEKSIELKNEVTCLKKETLAENIQNSAKFLEVKNEVSDLKKETLTNQIQDSAKCIKLQNEVSSLKKETLETHIQDSAKYQELKNEVSNLKKETLANKIQESAKSLELNNEVYELKKETLTNQIHDSAKSLIVKDLVPLKAAGKESLTDLNIQFQNVLSELQIKENVNVVTILRLKSNKMVPFKGKSTVLPTKVTFNCSSERELFLSKLKYLKKFKAIKVSIDYPKLLQSSKNELEHIAYKIRKDMPGTKTSIRIKDQKLAIFARKNGETNFSEVEEY